MNKLIITLYEALLIDYLSLELKANKHSWLLKPIKKDICDILEQLYNRKEKYV